VEFKKNIDRERIKETKTKQGGRVGGGGGIYQSNQETNEQFSISLELQSFKNELYIMTTEDIKYLISIHFHDQRPSPTTACPKVTTRVAVYRKYI